MPRLRWVLSSLKTKNDMAWQGLFAWQGEANIIMKRKPDILWILVLVFGLGVVTTGYTQGLWERSDASAPMIPISHSQQLQR